MDFIKNLIENESEQTYISIRGTMGNFKTQFQPHKKIFVLEVAQIVGASDKKKVKFNFNKKTNLLECFVNNRYYGTARFKISWVESNKYKRINI